MHSLDFDSTQFYRSYPTKVIARPGYPARAAYKAALFWNLYGARILADLGQVNNYADIGGCFGFGANSMAFHISQCQGFRPRTSVYEISPGFVDIGRILFPQIEFIGRQFGEDGSKVESLDLVTVFDVVEHVVDVEPFLQSIASRSRYVMLKTPMETTGDWRGNKPCTPTGEDHPDGHVNFFSPRVYESLLRTNGLDIIGCRVVQSYIPLGAEMALIPDSPKPGFRNLMKSPKLLAGFALRKVPGISWQLKRKLLSGGDHLCICRSRLV